MQIGEPRMKRRCSSFHRLILVIGLFFSSYVSIHTILSLEGYTVDVENAPSFTRSKSSAIRSWSPSKMWIDECVKDLESSEKGPFRVVWRRYVLGDCMKQCRNCYNLKCVRHPEKTKQRGSGCYQKTSSNQTFAALYHFRACRSNHHALDGNLTIVDEILEEAGQNDPSFVKPPSDSLVIHLRLGDVIENAKESVTSMLLSGGNPWHTDTYKNSIKSIDEYLKDIEGLGLKKIIIRGGSHDPNYFQKSRIYAGCLYRAIQTAGYSQVTMQLEGIDPDHDFYFISHAKFLSVSAGGFSRLMGKMVKRNGGEIVGREFIKNFTEGITLKPE